MLEGYHLCGKEQIKLALKSLEQRLTVKHQVLERVVDRMLQVLNLSYTI